MRYLIDIVVASIPTVIIGLWVIKRVAEQRGYEAIGGEWFLIVMIFTVFYFFVDRAMHH